MIAMEFGLPEVLSAPNEVIIEVPLFLAAGAAVQKMCTDNKLLLLLCANTLAAVFATMFTGQGAVVGNVLGLLYFLPQLLVFVSHLLEKLGFSSSVTQPLGCFQGTTFLLSIAGTAYVDYSIIVWSDAPILLKIMTGTTSMLSLAVQGLSIPAAMGMVPSGGGSKGDRAGRSRSRCRSRSRSKSAARMRKRLH